MQQLYESISKSICPTPSVSTKSILEHRSIIEMFIIVLLYKSCI